MVMAGSARTLACIIFAGAGTGSAARAFDAVQVMFQVPTEVVTPRSAGVFETLVPVPFTGVVPPTFVIAHESVVPVGNSVPAGSSTSKVKGSELFMSAYWDALLFAVS